MGDSRLELLTAEDLIPDDISVLKISDQAVYIRQSVADVRNLVLPGVDNQPIRLMSVADVRIDRGPAEIHRLQQQRAS